LNLTHSQPHEAPKKFSDKVASKSFSNFKTSKPQNPGPGQTPCDYPQSKNTTSTSGQPANDAVRMAYYDKITDYISEKEVYFIAKSY
jgi:hypothetical protein